MEQAREFERALAYHCAPSMAGIKAADLFTWPNGSGQEIRRYAGDLARRGICLRELRRGKRRTLLLVYRPACLERCLSCPRVRAMLERAGYPAGVSPEELLGRLMERLEGEVVCEDGVQTHIAAACGGDVRKAMNAVELLLNSAKREQGKLLVTLADAQTVAQRSAMRYDREGDDHFDIASALMKSLRGSDPDAALHYLARLLEAGDLITAIRRLLCSASEDVGMAYPQAALIVKACVDNALQLGLPEARLPLAQAAVLLATAPKSNSVYRGIAAAQADVRAGKTGDYPRHLQNVHADSAGMEREQGYLYPHDFPNHWVKQQYLPDILAGTQYYIYGENKTEQAARRYWEEIKGRE